MKVEIRGSFTKDADKLPAHFQHQLANRIAAMKQAVNLSALNDCKKLAGHKTAYRLRMGSYRIGFYYERKTIELVRILDRKEIYRYFP
jgi:mRNA interferase RelE/StbE